MRGADRRFHLCEREEGVPPDRLLSLDRMGKEGRLPRDWKAEPPPASTKQLGDAWVRESRSAVLVAPSVIIPDEVNYMLNPAHADFREITTGNPQEFPSTRGFSDTWY